MTVEGKVAEAERLKDTGNAHFKAGNFKGAASSYARALAYTTGLHGARSELGMGYAGMLGTSVSHDVALDDTQEAAIIALNEKLQCNLATTYLRFDPPKADKALTFATKVLEHSPEGRPHPKAALRAGQALLLQGNARRAETILALAAKSYLKADAIGKGLRTELKRARAALKSEESTFGAGMFGRAGGTAASDAKGAGDGGAKAGGEAGSGDGDGDVGPEEEEVVPETPAAPAATAPVLPGLPRTAPN